MSLQSGNSVMYMGMVSSADDHSRVVLTQLDHKTGRDYINASFTDVSYHSQHNGAELIMNFTIRVS